MYGLVEIDILSDMARRISTYDYFIPAALHQNQKLQELGLTQNEIIARLSALTGQTQEELVSLLSEASAEAIESRFGKQGLVDSLNKYIRELSNR